MFRHYRGRYTKWQTKGFNFKIFKYFFIVIADELTDATEYTELKIHNQDDLIADSSKSFIGQQRSTQKIHGLYIRIRQLL